MLRGDKRQGRRALARSARVSPLMRSGAARVGYGTGIYGLDGGLAGAMLRAETDGLAVDFTDLSTVIKDTTTPANNFSGNPNNKLTYSSPSTKWILGSNGLYSSGTTLRTEYNTSGAALGVRIEEARTNLMLRSQEFDNASWISNESGQLTITANQATAPDGSATADLCVPAANFGPHLTRQLAATAAAVHTHSVFAKAVGGYTQIALRENGVVGHHAAFSLSGAGTVIDKIGSATASITALTNGWYKCDFTPVTAALNMGYAVYVMDGGYVSADPAAYSFTGNGTSGVYLWQAQLEQGAYATSPIVTAGATVTRAADAISLATTSFAYSASILTVLTNGQFLAAANPGAANEVMWALGSGGVTGASVDRYAGGATATAYRDASIQVDMSLPIAGSAFKLAVAAQVADMAAVLNGGAPYTNAGAAAVGARTTLGIGALMNAANTGNLYLKQLLHVPRRMSNGELQTLTT